MPKFDSKEEYENWKQQQTQKVETPLLIEKEKNPITDWTISLLTIGLIGIAIVGFWKKSQQKDDSILSDSSLVSSQPKFEQVDATNDVSSLFINNLENDNYSPYFSDDEDENEQDDRDDEPIYAQNSTYNSSDGNSESMKTKDKRELNETKRNRLNITLLSTSWCPACRQVRAFLEDNDIDFTEYDVEKEDEGFELYRKHNGRVVPLLIIDEQAHSGFSLYQLKKLLYF